MKKREYQSIRLSQLAGVLTPDATLKSVQRPVGGWLKAVRQALGRSLKSVGQELKLTPQSIHQLEKSEAAGTISLKQLEACAEAMGCRLIYTLLPREGTLAELSEAHSGGVLHRSVHHTMALEGQGIPPATLAP